MVIERDDLDILEGFWGEGTCFGHFGMGVTHPTPRTL
jgi:hypothetical protein